MTLKAICSTIALLVAASPVSAQSAGCPARAGDPLISIELFDGAVSENVVLAPDQSSGTATNGKSVWRVGSVYDDGRLLTIACHYKSSQKPLMIEIAQKVLTCTHTINAKTGGTFTCR